MLIDNINKSTVSVLTFLKPIKALVFAHYVLDKSEYILFVVVQIDDRFGIARRRRHLVLGGVLVRRILIVVVVFVVVGSVFFGRSDLVVACAVVGARRFARPVSIFCVCLYVNTDQI